MRTPPGAQQQSLIDLGIDEPISSCRLCELPDDNEMVQCDDCDVWFHFDCVGVDENVAKVPWSCLRCTKKADEARSIQTRCGRNETS